MDCELFWPTIFAGKFKKTHCTVVTEVLVCFWHASCVVANSCRGFREIVYWIHVNRADNIYNVSPCLKSAHVLCRVRIYLWDVPKISSLMRIYWLPWTLLFALLVLSVIFVTFSFNYNYLLNYPFIATFFSGYINSESVMHWWGTSIVFMDLSDVLLAIILQQFSTDELSCMNCNCFYPAPEL